MFYVSIVLNIPLGRITWEYRGSVSVLLVSALLPLTPADNSYTPLRFARVDRTLSNNPSTEEEFATVKGYFVVFRCVMGCKSHHAMLDPYCGGTTCTRAAGSVLLRAKLTMDQEKEFFVRCGVENLLLGLVIVVPRCGEVESS